MTFASLFLGPFVEVKFKTLKQLRDLLSSIEIVFVCYSHIILLNVGYFGNGCFGHGHFGQDIPATDISAM